MMQRLDHRRLGTQETADLENIAWGAAMHCARLFVDSSPNPRYAETWNISASDELTKGAVHFAEMATHGFCDEADRIVKGITEPEGQKLCFQLGASLAHADVDEFDNRLQEYASTSIIQTDHEAGSLLTADRCRNVFAGAVIGALHERAEREFSADAFYAVRVAVLGGPMFVEEIAALFGLELDEAEAFVGGDKGLDGNGSLIGLTADARLEVLRSLHRSRKLV